MKKTTRLLSLALVLVLCLSVLPVGAAAYTGWIYNDSSTEYLVNNEAVSGWYKIGGYWYYFEPEYHGEDYVIYNMVRSRGAELPSGSGNHYYFNSKGVMVASQWVSFNQYNAETDTYTKVWEYYLSSGKRASGWQKIGGVWYYFDPYNDGVMLTGGPHWIKDNYYYFKDSGALFTGWKKFTEDDGYTFWAYFTSNGAVKNGWKQIGGKWYCFSNYAMLTSWYQDDNGDWYYLGSDGAMVASKWVHTGSWYYQLSSGKGAKGWQKIGGVWYYFDPDNLGAMVTGGPLWIDGNYYFFKSSGALYTGWKSIDGDWWYFTSNGAVKNGWKKINGKWYQFADYICLNP